MRDLLFMNERLQFLEDAKTALVQRKNMIQELGQLWQSEYYSDVQIGQRDIVDDEARQSLKGRHRKK